MQGNLLLRILNAKVQLFSILDSPYWLIFWNSYKFLTIAHYR